MHKKRIFAALLAAVALCSAFIYASAADVVQKDGLVYIPDHSVFFADVDEHYAWAVQPVDYLANHKVISGTADCVYSPERALSRADFVTMLTRAYDMNDYVGGGSFSDVSDGAYYSDAVSAAKNLGIVSGDGSGKFNPKSALTRQDAMVMMRRTLDKTGLKFAEGSLSAFSDAKTVSAYAQNDVAALAKAGIISGANGKVSPKNSVTRAEMAVMLYRAMMLQPDETGAPVYTPHSNVVNLCIGESFYPNVTVENAEAGQTFSGLYTCETMRGEGEDFMVSLGASRKTDQTIVWKDGILSVNGETVSVAENCDAISLNPYGLISGGLVSTGGTYKSAAVSLVDGVVTAVYYAK